MKTIKAPAFLVRQEAITYEEWIELIRQQAERLQPFLSVFTLQKVRDLPVIYWGGHAANTLDRYVPNCVNGPLLDVQGVFPTENTHYIKEIYNDHFVKTFWALDRNGGWRVITILMTAHYDRKGINDVTMRIEPTSYKVENATLDSTFFSKIVRTPKQVWYDLANATKVLINKRRQLWEGVIELDKANEQIMFVFDSVPQG